MRLYTQTSVETVAAQRKAYEEIGAVIPAPLTGWERFKAVIATQKPTVAGTLLNTILLLIILALGVISASGIAETFGISLVQLGWYDAAVEAPAVYTTETGVFGEGSAIIGGGN